MKRLFCLLFALPLALVLGGCPSKSETGKVHLEKREIPARTTATGATPLRVAIGAMITPKEGFAYYRDFLSYIEEKMGRPIEFVSKQSYGEINDMLKAGSLDFAFVCSGPYVIGHKNFGLRLLVAPVVNGAPTYHSYIIVNQSSPAKDFKSLKGKVFAFTDPLSNTGTLVPTFMLAKMKETPKSFFGESVFTKTHDTSIRLVADKMVDGAAVDSLIWEYMNKKNGTITSRTRIVEKSTPYGIPPVVVTRNMDPATIKLLRSVFLNADKDEKGKQLLNGMMTERFVEVPDSIYDSVREMIAWTERTKRP